MIRLLTTLCAGTIALALTACGGKETETGNSGKEQESLRETPEWVYVPEFIPVEEQQNFYSVQFLGNNLYYMSSSYDEETGKSTGALNILSMTDQKTTTVPLEPQEGGLNSFALAKDGSLYVLEHIWGEEENQVFLDKFDTAGKLVFRVSMAEPMKQEETESLQNLYLDGQDRVYVTADQKILLFQADGTYKGAVKTDDWINSAGCGKDGDFYFTCYYYDGTKNGYKLFRVDFDKAAVGETYGNFPSGGNNQLISGGTDYDFLTQDGSKVYGYRLADQSSEVLFRWLDSDINGNYVNGMGLLEDGRIAVIANDWESNVSEFALLTKTPGSEVSRKETIVIATLSSSSNLQKAAVNFNKKNDKYRVTLKEYYDYNNWTENAYSDAITRFNNDITSGNCPDIVALSSYINIKSFVSKNVFADLTPYLEKSTILSKENYLENTLNAFTFQDKLIGIPKTFSLQTLAGKASDLGDRMGWTMDEMMQYADSHPDADLLEFGFKENVLSQCMMFNESAFVDWSTGECKFDSPEFKKILEFANRFPSYDENKNYSNAESSATRIKAGKLLTTSVYLSDFREVQMYNAMFDGDITFIGYPTVDGSVGCAMMADDVYAISDRSGYKDGAWEFIESYLADDTSYGDWWNGFPTNREKLQKMFEDSTRVEYVLDENGDPYLDENGDPIVQGGGGSVAYEDGWEYTYHVTTEEEANQAMALFDVAKPMMMMNEEIQTIISEEADAYFKGMKSVDDVAAIIQSRVMIYVSENS